MLLSLAWIFLLGLALGGLMQKLGLPSLLGMLLTGILLARLGAIDASLLDISASLREIALVIILLRAGLNLSVQDLKRAGRPAVLLCFLPAVCEIGGILLLAPPLLGCTRLEAVILGSTLAAVSPAVIVPRMLRLMEEGWGKTRAIPQMIMAGASVDDVFVIVLFTAFTGLAQGGGFSPVQLARIPTSILFGVAVGAVCGLALNRLFRRIHLRDSAKVLILLSAAFLLVSAEDAFTGPVGFSGLLAVMAMGASLQANYGLVAGRLSSKFGKLWVAAEVLLFVLVGAAVDPAYLLKAGPAMLVVIVGALAVRMLGVALCVAGTRLTGKERLFCAIAYCPKATVQAAIGPLPLAMGLACGPMVLAGAVLAILLTAPLGALVIDHTYKRLLRRDEGFTV